MMVLPALRSLVLLYKLRAAHALAKRMSVEQFAGDCVERRRLFARVLSAKRMLSSHPDLFAKRPLRPKKPLVDPKAAHTAIAIAAACAQTLKIPLFLVSGTFLGQHRDGKLLEHDYDIDLGLFAPHARIDEFIRDLTSGGPMVLFERYLITAEYAAHHPWARNCVGMPILIGLRYKGIKIDLFLHYRDNGRIYHGSLHNTWCNSEFGLTGATLQEIPILVPADADRYLTENYGDWRTPLKEYDRTADTPNIVPTHTIRSLRQLMKRISRTPSGHRYQPVWQQRLSETYSFIEGPL